MDKKPALLFLPDISGFTDFVQSTEVEHSQHVIAELLEVLIGANEINLKLAEIEGDALFFYREDLPTPEEFYKQVESTFKAFHEHLEMLKTHRICPCNACASAPQLQLKIIAHCGPVEFIKVQQSSKPFGPHVIEAHRLLKNSVASDTYLLVSDSLHQALDLGRSKRDLFSFCEGAEKYDGKQIGYHYALVDATKLELKKPRTIEPVELDSSPDIVFERKFPVERDKLYEYIANYRYRHLWNQGVDSFQFPEHEVTRLGSEHACVIKYKSLDFIAVTKAGQENQLIYGELTEKPISLIDSIYQFMTIEPISKYESSMLLEVHLIAKSPLKRILVYLIARRFFHKKAARSLDLLHRLVAEQTTEATPVKIAP